MGKWEKVEQAVMSGRSDSGIRFNDLAGLLRRKGFEYRVKGSHHWYQRAGFSPVNLQPVKGMAKPYQVRQVRQVLEEGEQ